MSGKFAFEDFWICDFHKFPYCFSSFFNSKFRAKMTTKIPFPSMAIRDDSHGKFWRSFRIRRILARFVICQMTFSLTRMIYTFHVQLKAKSIPIVISGVCRCSGINAVNICSSFVDFLYNLFLLRCVRCRSTLATNLR